MNGKGVKCKGNEASEEWRTMLSFAGQDVTLLYAQNHGCTAIEDHQRKEFEAHLSNLVCDMYDDGHVMSRVVGKLGS